MTIASSGQNTLALFAEIIVLTTLCGRSLLSKQLPPTEDTYGRESSSNFWTRHKWLFQMVQKRLSLLSLPASSAELLDPMRLFTNMLANAAVIWLWDVMEMQSWDKDKQLFFAPADVYSALQSACEIADLAKTLKRSNFLKVRLITSKDYGRFLTSLHRHIGILRRSFSWPPSSSEPTPLCLASFPG